MANLLQTYYFVQGIWVSAYVIEKGKMGRVLEISGTAQNIDIATYVHAFVNHHIDSQWRVYCGGKRLSRYRKSDFAVGLIEGFCSKLEAGQKTPESKAGEYALVKFKDPLLGDYMRHRYPHTRSFTRKTSTHDEGIIRDGFKIGSRMVISKGISQDRTSTGQNQPKLLIYLTFHLTTQLDVLYIAFYVLGNRIIELFAGIVHPDQY